MAYNFNNDSVSPPGRESGGGLGTAAPAAPADAATTSPTPAPASADSSQSAALIRFRSCRWQQPAENGNSEFCTHREVKPYAGTTGFDADAWCPDCQYYKLRRAPKKRDRDEFTY